MEIIGKTNQGFIINATKGEVEEILSAILGEVPKEIHIGQKIPAIDYASTIRKIKALHTNTTFQYMLDYMEKFNSQVEGLKKAVQSAASLE
jgi:hypothetical protein